MNKILLIIEREFLTRVKKKSFIIMTVLTPILFAGIMVASIYLSMSEDTELKSIAVIDDSQLFEGKIPDTEYTKFQFIHDKKVEDLKSTYQQEGYYAVLYISHIIASSPDGAILYSEKQPPMDVTQHIEGAIKKEIETQKLMAYNIENLPQILESIKTKVNVRTIKWTKDGEEKESSTLLAMGFAYILSFIIYMLIFLFGSQVMRGVIEEKNNRIVEVIVSSVKPFQLMLGKIIGIASVSMLQIFVWIVLTFGLFTAGSSLLIDKASDTKQTQEVVTNLMEQQGVSQAIPVTVPTEQNEQAKFMNMLSNINFPLIIGGFIFFFLGGYLLYAAMFAAVGSAVDNEADSQQLVTPITIPLILALLVMASGLKAPDGPLAFWFSMIPFTSPIVMVTRLPYGVPTWQLITSGAILIATFLLFTWLAAKIYRTGILLYGKKYTWKEMWKWIRYSN
ncbi:MAG: ABC transporter permease [Tenuifilaceae bacterium]|jgi:ABC-2 type transport system permease protein|nr:ABC transporter permease [Tenuifilaceae bacterium]